MKREEALMIAKPILFDTEMVRAILDGRKTQTRMPIKPGIKNKSELFGDGFYQIGKYDSKKGCISWEKDSPIPIKSISKRYSPYKVGDILYVRETWAVESVYGNSGVFGFDCLYKADDKIIPCVTSDFDKYCNWAKFFDKQGWSPSIHMPKEAARIFLKVKDVRVRRVQDITDADVIAEGFVDSVCDYKGISCQGSYDYCNEHESEGCFSRHWNNHYAKKGYDWDSNPWVWAYDFERLEVV